MNEQMTGILLTVLGSLAIALIGIFGNLLVKRMRPGTTQPEIWKRVDELTVAIYGDGKENPGLLERVATSERRGDAMGRIIRDLAGQWVGPRPRLDPSDLAELDERFIPATHPWRQKPSDETSH